MEDSREACNLASSVCFFFFVTGSAGDSSEICVKLSRIVIQDFCHQARFAILTDASRLLEGISIALEFVFLELEGCLEYVF